MFYIELSLRVKVIFTIKYSIICYLVHLLNTTIPVFFLAGAGSDPMRRPILLHAFRYIIYTRRYRSATETSMIENSEQSEDEPSSRFPTYFKYKTLLNKHYIY